MTTLVSPVVARPTAVRHARVEDGTQPTSAATATVSAAEPVFAGHYPGFPIFPGVCLIEHAHRTCLATAPDDATELLLEAVESTRFLAPAFPDDELMVEVGWKHCEGGYRCTAQVHTARGEAARIRLRYREVREGA